jgi:transposase InsO family protein
MTHDAQKFHSGTPYAASDQVVVGNGDTLPITHSGNLSFSSGPFVFPLSDVLHVPSLRKNLLSVAQFTRGFNVSITFFHWGYQIRDLQRGVVLFQGLCKNGLYPIFPTLSSSSKQAFSSSLASSSLWHRRLGHPSNKVLRTLVSRSLLGSFSRLSNSPCSHCALAKSIKLPFSSHDHCSTEPFALIHSDVWMSPVVSVSGYRYYVLFTDDYTRYSWIFPMRLKSEVFGHFSTFAMYVKTQFSLSIKQFQSDGGKEYDNLQFKQFCATNGIVHRFSCPHTPQQNGLAERKHRHIADMGRTLLHTAHMPHNLWVEAFCTAISLINRLPTPILQGTSPYKLLFGVSPDYTFLRVFGCICYPYLGDYVTNKLQPRSLQCVFVGYSDRHHGYRCLHPPTGRLYVSRHVIFHEDQLYYVVVSKHVQLSDLVVVPVGFLPNPPAQSITADNSQTSARSISGSTSSPSLPVDPSSPQLASINSPQSAISSPSSDPRDPTPPDLSISSSTPWTLSPLVPFNDLVIEPPPPSDRVSPVHTRSKSGIVKPNPKYHANFSTRYPVPHAFSALVNTDIEPTCYTQASRHPEWKQAMLDEYHALLQQGTWSLVPSSPSLNTVGCKWVFRIKRRSDGTIERYKARLVAKGFHQQSGVDYFDTFSPVVKPTTIRTVLCLAISFGWPLRQLDVKNAFLHGSLSEDVYMRQPPGFADPHRPNHVCKLHKAIYGLKQAPRAWFQRFSSFLLRVGFTQSKADNSMFIYHDHLSVMILLLYVDDIILTGSNSSHLLAFLRTLGAEFDIKDLGRLHYFLGVEVHYHPTSIHLTQNQYTVDLLKRINLLDCKPVSTPMTSKGTLSRTHGTVLADPTPYRQMVGAL